VILETALADALYLNWSVPLAALPPAPAGLRYDSRHAALSGTDDRAANEEAFFSLVLFRQVGLHLRGASWLGLTYPQANARLYVRDAANTPSVLLLRQLVPGWVVPLARLAGGQPVSAAICDFPNAPSGPTRPPSPGAAGEVDAAGDREWRWRVAAGAQFSAAVRIGSPASFPVPPSRGSGPAGRAGSTGPGSGEAWWSEVGFFRDRTRAYWRQGQALRRVEAEHPATTVLPVRARIECSDWLEAFVPFAPASGWAGLHSAFLVPRVQMVLSLVSAPEMHVAAPVAAAG
jgi:hypothetical protein